MGLQYLAADEVSQRFRDSTSGTPCQLMPYERILETRPEANEVLLGFLRNCKRELRLHDAFTGPLKDLTAAEKKAKRDYNGRSELVTDYVRGKVVVRTPEEIKALKQTLGNRNSDLMHNSGIYLVHMTDFFEDPKDLTGYRALNCKLAVPVSGGDYHVVELQVVAEQIEKIYDQTHPYKARAEALHDQAASEGRELTKGEKREAAYSFTACRLFNGRVARDAGYDELLKPEVRSKHELSRHREIKLQGMVDDLHRMVGLDNV